MPRSRAIALVAISVALGVMGASSAEAAPRCASVIFSCGGGDVLHFKNLAQLKSERRSLSWIRKNCRAVQKDPADCDWRRGRDEPRPAADRTQVLTPSPEAAPARRDATGKYGPTPAPRQAQVAVDDGPWADAIALAAERYRLPPLLLRAVLQVESGGNPQARSHKGALGLMQLMPDTARAMGVEDPLDPEQNIQGGARFLRVLANRFDGDLVKVLSAYHAGSTRVKGRGATPFAATDDYVRKVLRLYYQLRDAGDRAAAGGGTR